MKTFGSELSAGQKRILVLKFQTLSLCFIAGLLMAFALLEPRTNIHYSWRNAFEHYYMWLFSGHINGGIVVFLPFAFTLIGLIVFRFIDYSKQSAND